MIECKLERQIFTFDGHIIHRLHPSGIAMHFHVDFVESAIIEMDKKGRQFIKINLMDRLDRSLGLWPDRELTPETLPQAQAFVDEVMKAKESR